MRGTLRESICVLASSIVFASSSVPASAAPATYLALATKSWIGELRPATVTVRDDDEFWYEFAPPTHYAGPIYKYPPRPEFDDARPIYEWAPEPPSSCGKYRYWNGERCADARFEPPYIGPKW